MFVIATVAIPVCKAQNEINFNISYLPNLEYTVSQEQNLENIIKYSGTEDALQGLKDKGVENPKVTVNTVQLQSVLKTGNLKGSQIPTELEFIESSDPSISVGTKIYGNVIDGKIKFDSISSPTLTEEGKQTALSVMESMLNQIEFPNKKFKIGEHFTQSRPLSLPIGNLVLDMDISTTYTLTAIKDGIGYFDIDQIYTAKSNIEGYEMKIKGTGGGTMEYDIENQFYRKYVMDLEMDMTMDIEEITMEMKMNQKLDQTAEIKKRSN